MELLKRDNYLSQLMSTQMMSTAIIFEPKTATQMDLLTAMAQQMKITFEYVPIKKVRAYKRKFNATTIAAIKEAESGACEHFDTIEDYLKAFS